MIVLAGDISIGYDDDGRGLAVVFVHGFPHNRSPWTPQRTTKRRVRTAAR